MKTKQTILKSMAVLVSFLLVSFTISASEVWFSAFINESKVIAELMESYETDSIKNELKDTQLTLAEMGKSKELKRSEFNPKNKKRKIHLSFQKTTENKKMVSSSHFIFEEDKENKLQFESWMFNPKCWKATK